MRAIVNIFRLFRRNTGSPVFVALCGSCLNPLTGKQAEAVASEGCPFCGYSGGVLPLEGGATWSPAFTLGREVVIAPAERPEPVTVWQGCGLCGRNILRGEPPTYGCPACEAEMEARSS